MKYLLGSGKAKNPLKKDSKYFIDINLKYTSFFGNFTPPTTAYEKMKIIHRILKFIQNESISSDQLKSSLGLGKDALQLAVSEDGSVSTDVLEEICKQYPQLNPIWLVTGKGEMLIDDYHEIGKAIENVESQDGIYNVIAGKDIEIQLLKEHIEGLNELIKVKNKLIDEYKNA
ncbi:MAG: hypothetical protein ABJO02_02960 [Reichenbachiella sp.]|uniref:hypothetical protein n=1 Tax=Reichenbachiella sp. TaxID=2184521 RepID=UPI0032993319